MKCSPINDKKRLLKKYVALIEQADTALKENRITQQEWERLHKVYDGMYEELRNKGIRIHVGEVG